MLKSRPNLVAQQEIDEADARDRGSEAAVAAAKAALAAAEQQVQVSQADLDKVKTMFAYTRITAPFAGVITKRYADTGAMIQAGTASQTQAMPVVRLSQNDRAAAGAAGARDPSCRASTSARPSRCGWPTLGRSFPGPVARFSGQVQLSTRTMETEVDVPNPSLVLMPGMYAQAMLTLDRKADVLAVPVQAISATDTHPTVLVVNAAEPARGAPREAGPGDARPRRSALRPGVGRAGRHRQPRPAQAGADSSNPRSSRRLAEGGTLMSGFAIRNPYFIVVVCLMIAVVGVTSLVRMPVDMFPAINIPVVVVATFYSGMPPEQIETDITSRFERFFTLASGIEHIESRSLPGVSLIKIYFQPGTNADSAVTTISNLAMADLRRLPPGTLPPVVLKFDASSLPVCLVTLKGEGLNETQLRDLAQFQVRNQVANVPGASVPPPFGGKYRQIMVYVDPLQAGSAPAQPDGRGARRERLQPDPAGRRRADRPARLQHLHQQPAPRHSRTSTSCP